MRDKDDSTNNSGVWTTFMRGWGGWPSLGEKESLDSIQYDKFRKLNLV